MIKKIIENFGFLTEDDLNDFAAEFPNAPLVIKWACSPRSIHAAKDVEKVISQTIAENPDYEYVREVFISAENLDKLREVLGINKE